MGEGTMTFEISLTWAIVLVVIAAMVFVYNMVKN